MKTCRYINSNNLYNDFLSFFTTCNLRRILIKLCCLGVLCCAGSLFLATAHAEQTCKPDSIPATTPDNQLLDNGNGTITDTKTGLMWKQCLEGVSGDGCDIGTPDEFTWKQALVQPDMINGGVGFAGNHDWRLPNIKELRSIVEEQCNSPAINLLRFPNTPDSVVWSSSPAFEYSYSENDTWGVYFFIGEVYDYERDSKHHLRLVRWVTVAPD